ncbi:MAG: hypothetical protein IIC56_09995 [Proteobacteria bacterium]|nr:hypothetical protein [Pseudomonadota bacterium]
MRLVLAVVLAVGLWSPDKALAKKIDCGALLERMGRTGEFPGIKLNLAEGTVTVYLSRDHCQESIEIWSARPGPGEGKLKQPSPSAPKTVPAPVLVPPKTPAPKTTPPPAKTPAFPKIRAACDQRLDRLWPESQVIKIEGIGYWLARAFTVNFDGEPGIDDVGFVFKGLDDAERLIRYFGIPGEIPGLSLEGLGLADDGLIKRLCFGDVSYEKPPLFGKELAPQWIEVPKPDLAAEVKAKREGRPWPPRGKDKTAKSQKPPEEFSWWLWALIAGGAVAAIAAGAFFVIRRGPKKKPEDGDEEEEEEGEEEDDGEEDSDEEDDSDGGKKKKKGWLASLFKRGRRKKKKGSKDDDGNGDAEED